MKVVILTGAGISAESGIPTFRGVGGLWEGYPLEDVATPEAFRRSPELVHRFYNERRRQLQSADIQPNAAHYAIAEFENEHPHDFLLVTQNIDDLHQRAGSRQMVAMHGELLKARCVDTGDLFEWKDDLSLETSRPKNHSRHHDSKPGSLRPHVVWFGEMPLGLEQIERAAAVADLFVAIGTSAVVYPAAAIVGWTRLNCRRVEINVEDTPQSSMFDEAIRGPASLKVPEFLEGIHHAAQ